MGNVKIEELAVGRRRVTIDHSNDDSNKSGYEVFETGYSEDLINLILSIKGTKSLRDEIEREESNVYTQICLEKDILGYIDAASFTGKRILDFGCGSGASTIILARLFPKSEIVGIDLNQKHIEIAQVRASHYGYDYLDFKCSPSGDQLPCDIGMYDYIILSAVYEHLLPDEREVLLHQLWSILNPEGVLFIDQTPYRYFPFEGHTTHLPLVNYMPDNLAIKYAKLFSRRVKSHESWQTLLRRGIRGGSVKEIINYLSPIGNPCVLKPNQMGFRDRIDVWYAGYAVSITRRYPWAKPIQFLMKYGSKLIYYLTGIVFLPAISLAIKKDE